MANPEHLKILRQGVDVWNQWRRENPMSGLHLINVDLSGTDLSGTDLSGADLSFVSLRESQLKKTIFYKANVRDSYLIATDLTGADLRESKLNWADLTTSDLSKANLSGADLRGVNFSLTLLHQANFRNANIGWCKFLSNDLSVAIGLDKVTYKGPSYIDINTLYISHGKIPDQFLRGCGVPDDFITCISSIVDQPIQFNSCFISYSSQDQKFANRLFADLQKSGVRCWFAPKDLPIGAKIRVGIDEAIQLRDRFILILSTHSVGSQWVEQEVETALERERLNIV